MIRVLVVDDSAFVRKVLSEELSRQSDIEVVGDALDPYVARDKILRLKPDVVTLDLEMPRMDGLTFLAKLMKFHPLPVVVVSSVAPENSANALKALSLGAVEVVSKPGSALSTAEIGSLLARAVRTAASARVRRSLPAPVAPPSAAPMPTPSRHSRHVICVGASTGGTQAIEVLVRSLPANVPGLAVVQHMPPIFTAEFARRLDKLAAIRVKEASDGDPILVGQMLIAPGGYQMSLEKNGLQYRVRVSKGQPVHHQLPAVDPLFESAARCAGSDALGVLLTGMGADGAEGLLAMRRRGAFTLVQDEASSVIWGMPGEAVKLGAACAIEPLDHMSRAIQSALQMRADAAA
jgi:two-component system chemotaxis response regulator CheB